MSIPQDRLYAVVQAGISVEMKYYDLCNQLRDMARAMQAGALDTNAFLVRLELATGTAKHDVAEESKIFEVEKWRYKLTHKRNEANKVRLRYSRAGQPYDKLISEPFPPRQLQVDQPIEPPSAASLGFGLVGSGIPMTPPPPHLFKKQTYVPSGTEYDEDTQREIDIARGLVAPGPTNDEMIMAEMGLGSASAETSAPKKPTGLA